MSWTAEIEVPFGTELHRFRLGLGQFRDLERKFGGKGILQIIDHFRANAWKVDEMRDFLIIAMIGAGMTPSLAQGAVDQNIVAWPFSRNVDLFWKIISAAVVDAPAGSSTGKDQADEEEEAVMLSPSPAYSASEEPSATRRTKSGA